MGREVDGHDGNGEAGGGSRSAGPEGSAGAVLSRAVRRHFSVAKVDRDRTPALLARAEAIADARAFGLLGILPEGRRGPASLLDSLDENALDAASSRGLLSALIAGEAYGKDALGLSGVGLGGGGIGEGVGLGRVGEVGHSDGAPGPGTGGMGSPGTLGHGFGWGGSWDTAWAGRGNVGRGTKVLRLHRAPVDDDARLPPEAISRVVRQNFGRFRLCYERGLVRDPSLAGRVTTHFLVGPGGVVKSAADAGSDLKDREVVGCIVRAFYGLTFPAPPGDVLVGATYPIVLSPTD
jgi:hypothetical protein